MLRLVQDTEPEDDEAPPPRRRSRHDDEPPPRQDRSGGFFYRQRPSVFLRVARSLWLGVGFAFVAAIAYLAGGAGVLDPLFPAARSPVAVATAASTPAPARAPVAQPLTQATEVAAAAPQLPMPDVQGLVLLIRNAILALHQANATGNYAVLRALAAPAFQSATTPRRSAGRFTGLRTAELDLGWPRRSIRGSTPPR